MEKCVKIKMLDDGSITVGLEIDSPEETAEDNGSAMSADSKSPMAGKIPMDDKGQMKDASGMPEDESEEDNYDMQPAKDIDDALMQAKDLLMGEDGAMAMQDKAISKSFHQGM